MLPRAGFLQSTLLPNRIGFLIYFVTNRCNFRCPFCFYASEIEKGATVAELSLDEVERFARKTGPLAQLSLTGGEPFLRQDFPQVARLMATHCRPSYLTIPTNGSLTDRITEFLEGFLPDFPKVNLRLVLSIDGIGEEHDRLRGTPGAYARVRQTYDALAALKPRFGNLTLDANACFSAANQDHLRNTLRQLHEDFAFDNLSVTYARGVISDPTLKEVSVQKYIEINNYLNALPRTAEKRLFSPVWRAVRDVSRDHLIRTISRGEFVTHCVAGRKMVVVRETGEVAPCELLDAPLGNLRDYEFDIYAVLASMQAKAARQRIRKTRCSCSHECALASNVVWSPGAYPQLLLATAKNLMNKA